MGSFKQFIEDANNPRQQPSASDYNHQTSPEQNQNNFSGQQPTSVSAQPSQPVVPTHAADKPWSGKKEDVMKMWKNLRSDMPIFMSPLSKRVKGSTFGEDGIRITGSFQFITGVLSRLKELLAYENPNTKLRIIFRGIDKKRDADPTKESYVFYLNLEQRGTKKRRKKLI